MNEAVLPYNNTSGWSGTDTSEERARTADENGTTSRRQTNTLVLVGSQKQRGLTVTGLKDRTSMHHGQASSVLSVLHMAGKLDRLAEKRDRCHVYVVPEFVNGRETQPHGRNKPKEERMKIIQLQLANCTVEVVEEIDHIKGPTGSYAAMIREQAVGSDVAMLSGSLSEIIVFLNRVYDEVLRVKGEE